MNLLKLYFLIFLFFSCNISGQLHHQMLSSQGGLNTTQSGVIVSQTIGQTSVTGNYTNQYSKLGQGFQQPTMGRLLIKELNSAISSTIYPNPFENQITISYSLQELVSITVFDMAGKLIYKNKLSFELGDRSIDVSNLKSGVYLIQLQSKSNTSYSKIVKR
jgi:hypothetical protein